MSFKVITDNAGNMKLAGGDHFNIDESINELVELSIDEPQLEAVNYVAISEALGTSPSVVTAGLAADNLICAVYFTTLFALASKIPAEATQSATGNKEEMLSLGKMEILDQ
ncbi:hypothetical protein FXO37_29865 [Capsicum annuum]|nr:hypothetical protein FXO37_29865 [Capsicum annuum]